MNVDFSYPRDIVIVQQIKRRLSALNVKQIIDDSDAKTVTAVTEQLGNVVLWSGDAYDAIGQWTDADVKKRLNEIYI